MPDSQHSKSLLILLAKFGEVHKGCSDFAERKRELQIQWRVEWADPKFTGHSSWEAIWFPWQILRAGECPCGLHVKVQINRGTKGDL